MKHHTQLILSPEMALEPAWVDYNGHLNQAYYGVLFDRALDHALAPAGLGPDYIATRNLSFMTVECHTCFVRELIQPAKVQVASRIVDLDDKRLHVFCELLHAGEGLAGESWLAATAEFMFLHIDMATRRTAPWPSDVRTKLDAIKAQSADLPLPERAGRWIGLPKRG